MNQDPEARPVAVPSNEDPPWLSPADANYEIVRDIVFTVKKLAKQGTERWDLKMISSALRDLQKSAKVFGPYRHTDKVTVFGSARTPPDSAEYKLTFDFAKKIAAAGYMVITGGGPGIMQAGNEGAGHEMSFGASIQLPWEARANPVLENNPRHVSYKFFFTRKLILIRESKALVCLPGGFGTMDEAFEALTLIQTGKCVPSPVVFLEPPGNGEYDALERFFKNELAPRGYIDKDDLALICHSESADHAVAHIQKFYSRYHSIRYVGPATYLRMKSPLPEGALATLDTEFASLLESGGRFQAVPASPDEADEPEIAHLPRIVFPFNRRSFARLRRLIDRINEF